MGAGLIRRAGQGPTAAPPGCDAVRVDPSVDERPRRQLLVPVALGTVLLSVIGASVGLVMHGRADRLGAASPRPAVTASSAPAAPVRTGKPVPVKLVRTAVPCWPRTQAAADKAGGDGTVYIQVQYTTENMEAWICADGSGRLFLQTRRSIDGDQWTEGGNTFFAADAVRSGEGYTGTYVGADGNHTITVDPVELRIDHPGWHEQEPVRSIEQLVDRAAPADSKRPGLR